MGTQSKTLAVRQLVPKSYHFDGYNELNCPNSRDRPFFSDSVVPMGKYTLTTRLCDGNTLEILFSSVCSMGKIVFEPFKLTLNEYIEKLKDAISEKRDFIYLKIIPKYHIGSEEFTSYDSYKGTNSNEYESFSCKASSKCATKDCTIMRKQRPNHVLAAISFNMEEVKQALAIYYQITEKTEVTTMERRKGIFGVNFKFGVCKDPNIASTLMGVAIKNPSTGRWVIYNPTTNTRTDVGSMKLGEFPILNLPAHINSLVPNDVIQLEDSRYYRIISKREDNNHIVTVMAPDGTIQERMLSAPLIPGLDFYTKVVAMDLTSFTDKSSNQNLSNNIMAAICLMQWSKGKDSESFTSLDDINDDSFNGLGAYLPALLAMNGGGMSGMPSIFQNTDGTPNLFALMALGGNNNDEDLQMLLVSQMLNNGQFGLPGGTVNNVSSTVTPAEEGEVRCENCKEVYPAGTNFCPKCGNKTVPNVSRCKNCGAELMKDATFCHKCGSRVTPNVCTKCGNTLTGEEAFCPKCGTAVNGVASSVTPSAEVTPASQEEVDADTANASNAEDSKAESPS